MRRYHPLGNRPDPDVPRRVLGLPQPRVLAGLKGARREDRTAAFMLRVLDTSASMNDEERRKRRAQAAPVRVKGRAAGSHRAEDSSDRVRAIAGVR